MAKTRKPTRAQAQVRADELLDLSTRFFASPMNRHLAPRNRVRQALADSAALQKALDSARGIAERYGANVSIDFSDFA